MDFKALKDSLARNAVIFEKLLKTVPGGQAAWKPAPEKWSILEVVNHLVDEEQEDFRQRVRLTLEDPRQDWPPIDPEGWVTERKYGEREYGESLKKFFEERRDSLAWLESLKDPQWDNSYAHPKAGPLSAGDLMASWVAHDYLHLRQICMLLAAYVAVLAEPYSTRYALP